MRPKPVLAVLGVTLSIGIALGYAGHDQPIQYRTITVHSPPQTITKVEEKEVITPTPLPESCRTVVSLTTQGFEQDKLISAAAGKINDGVFNGVSKLAGSQPSEWNKIEQDIYDAQQDMNEALLTKGEIMRTLGTKQAECDKALETS